MAIEVVEKTMRQRTANELDLTDARQPCKVTQLHCHSIMDVSASQASMSETSQGVAILGLVLVWTIQKFQGGAMDDASASI